MSLYLYIEDTNMRAMTANHLQTRRPTDSGCDLLCPIYAFSLSGTSRLSMPLKTGVVAAAVDASGNPMPCILMARSSMSQTPLRIANQLGLIDAGYRGELVAHVDFVDSTWQSPFYTIVQGRRLFQVVQHNWLPWKEIILVDSADALPAAPDNRGTGGFGSTGT
jgi:dUTP pyrophosphatase